jgi:hypothetical protein
MAHQELLDNQNTIHKGPGASFYAAWILLTLVCVPVAFVISLVLLGVIAKFVGDFIYVNGVQHITEDYLSLYLFFPLVGLLIGLAQYGLLRSLLPRMGGWVLATTAGWILGLILSTFPGWLGWTVSNDVDLLFILMGLSIGLAQWLVLRKRVSRALWWVAATLFGWGLLALFTTGNAMDQFGLFLITLLPACATAAALWWLLKHGQPAIPPGG